MRIEIPELSVVALIGVSGSGKSSFAKKYFHPTEVLSSDYFRALISDDENNQLVSKQAFDTLYYVANQRLELGKLTVIDATSVKKDARKPILELAKAQNCHAVAIVLDLPQQLCLERNARREDRSIEDHTIRRQSQDLRRCISSLRKEGFRYVYILKSPEETEEVEIVRTPLWNDKRGDKGPFDIIGDVHGCYDELCNLLEKLGYGVDRKGCTATAPRGRKLVFVGDLCDRGPKNVEVLRLVMDMVEKGQACCVAGNHDVKLLRKLRGKQVQMTHGLDKTFEQISAQGDDFIEKTKIFLDSLISHYVFDGGKLAVAHAGIKEKYQGRGSKRVRDFCLYGDTGGEIDEYGLPIRLPWANEYRGRAVVVYGHTPTPSVTEVNNTFCIDTGCVFGGKLTAFRYPEREIVETKALKEYYPPIRPITLPSSEADDMLYIRDVSGQRYIETRLKRGIKINEENSIAALEVMSRFAADPHWLIYLPPTMSPCETSTAKDYLEYPSEALLYYKSNGVGKAVCEEKHMGSRAVIVLCRDPQTAKRRFRVSDGSFGIIYTRTGRHFFEDINLQNEILARLCKTLEHSGFWEDFQTDWVCLDTELMPWSAKAQKLIAEQYEPVGRAGKKALPAAAEAIREALGNCCFSVSEQTALSNKTVDLQQLLTRYEDRATALKLYSEAYRRYCWKVESIEDHRIAAFHILAAENRVFSDKDHLWHMETIRRYMTGTDPLFMSTSHILVDLSDEDSIEEAISRWKELTEKGGEGMVIKPFDFIAGKGAKLLQPAVKCRGREYLRIIYGPEYMIGDNLQRLKKRSLSKKRSLALSEFSLGMEALERFVRKEPLYRVHECVFGILAMESEAVDPRL